MLSSHYQWWSLNLLLSIGHCCLALPIAFVLTVAYSETRLIHVALHGRSRLSVDQDAHNGPDAHLIDRILTLPEVRSVDPVFLP